MTLTDFATVEPYDLEPPDMNLFRDQRFEVREKISKMILHQLTVGPQQIIHEVERKLKRRLYEKVFDAMGDQPHVIKFSRMIIEENLYDDFFDQAVTCRMWAFVRAIPEGSTPIWLEHKPEVHAVPTSEKKPEKHYCRYCGSTSPDDSRGNCGACGAPR